MEGICLMNWGKCDFKELRQLQKRLEKMEKQKEEFCRICAEDLALRLMALATKRTPVGKAPRLEGTKTVRVKVRDAKGKMRSRSFLTAEAARLQKYWSGYTGGTLKKAWTIGQIRKNGTEYEVEVINPVFYASYVEYGHRQTPGRYVPALGKRLKKPWVKGKFMLTISEKEIQRMAPRLMERKLQKFLEECLDAE